MKLLIAVSALLFSFQVKAGNILTELAHEEGYDCTLVEGDSSNFTMLQKTYLDISETGFFMTKGDDHSEDEGLDYASPLERFYVGLLLNENDNFDFISMYSITDSGSESGGFEYDATSARSYKNSTYNLSGEMTELTINSEQRIERMLPLLSGGVLAHISEDLSFSNQDVGSFRSININATYECHEYIEDEEEVNNDSNNQ